MLPVQKYTPSGQRPRRSNHGFTLIEVILVIAVIMILAGITFGISRGVENAKRRSVAKAELTVLAQALEGYKSTHGDYPWAADGDELAQALMGWMAFSGSGSSVTFAAVSADDVPDSGPKSFIDPTKLDYSGTLPDEANVAPGTGAFQDPWGNDYIYKYKTSAADSWEVFGFHLYSIGANGLDGTTTAATGVLTRPDGDDDHDNIYAGE
jgi:prepilin-type N-terminal cleavage/methylation domain-containing protein